MTTAIPEAEYERDRELVLRCQEGDHYAFGELYELHFQRLSRFCLRYVPDPHVAEEIAQEAFVRALQALDSFKGERHFFAWLTVIARRLVVDRHRRDRRWRMAPAPPGRGSRAAEEIALSRIEGEHVRAALQRVRPRHRTVLQLREWEGLSYQAIAQQLGVSQATVPPLLHRARLALRREYLALTQSDLLAAVTPIVAAAVGPLRRLRDRVLQGLSQLPDANSLATPAAALALGLGVLGGWNGWPEPWFGGARPQTAVALVPAGPGVGGLALPSAAGRLAPTSPAAAQEPAWRGTKMLLGIVRSGADGESRRADDEQARNMPMYYEIGGYGLGANPQAMRDDLDKSTRGDTRWADGESNDRPSQCGTAGTQVCHPDPADWYLISES